jgi:ABC-type antimicrobial peptide transport system permease subunit
MSFDDYSYVFHPTPGMLLIKSDNPDETAEVLRKYGIGTFDEVKTYQDILNEEKDSNATTLRIFGIVIAIALGMTCIGMISNQLIGFEGRKKECAVMLSTAMNKKTLSDILLREMIITSVISSLVGTIVGSIMILVIKSALNHSDTLYMPISINPAMVLIFWVIITLVFALTVLFPIRNLKKMKIAEQIKYE